MRKLLIVATLFAVLIGAVAVPSSVFADCNNGGSVNNQHCDHRDGDHRDHRTPTVVPAPAPFVVSLQAGCGQAVAFVANYGAFSVAPVLFTTAVGSGFGYPVGGTSVFNIPAGYVGPVTAQVPGTGQAVTFVNCPVVAPPIVAAPIVVQQPVVVQATPVPVVVAQPVVAKPVTRTVYIAPPNTGDGGLR